MNLNPYITTYTKFKLRWIMDTNTNTKIIKLLDGNRGEHLHDLGAGKSFLDVTHK